MTLDRAFIKAFAEAQTKVERTPSAAAPIVATVVPEVQASTRTTLRMTAPDALSDEETEHLLRTPPATMAPLSSFASPPRSDERLQPGLEVDELAWPKACTDLLSRARRGWDRFVEPLVKATTQGDHCVAIASCVRGEGRTTVTLATAKHLAARGLNVAVVDADFERPSLAQSLGIAPQVGWADVVCGELPLGEALISAPGEHVTVVPWQGRPATADPCDQPTRAAACFETLRENFDLVLIDAAPLASGPVVSDLVRLAEVIPLDAVYLVYDARFATPKQLKTVTTRLEQASLPLAGIIENFVAPASVSEAGPRHRLPSFAGRTLAPHT